MTDKRPHKRSPYEWDEYSDQPLPIRDKAYKRRIRFIAIPALLRMLMVTLLTLPITMFRYFFEARFHEGRSLQNRIGLCVNFGKEPEITPALVKELGVRRLSLRIPLADIDNLESYADFVKCFNEVEWLFVILQDREHIEDLVLLEKNVERIFSELGAFGSEFQIANAINRTKWAFSSVDEYLGFFKVVQRVRDNNFPSISLLGSSVIDFEVYALLRSLWHLSKIRYDGVAALLYVDRRGAPENKQFIFDVIGKINFFWSAIKLSPQTDNKLVINEVNWPIEHTRPYAPALDDVWVSEQDYCNYMLRYYYLALANGNVDCIYWHQLIAPGYGLIDNRDNELRKRRAYFAFKILVKFMQGAIINSIVESAVEIEIFARDESGLPLKIWWMKEGSEMKRLGKGMHSLDAAGDELPVFDGKVLVGAEPVIFYTKS